MHQIWGDARSWLIAGAVAGGAIVLSLIVHRIIFFIAARLSRRKGSQFWHSFAQHARGPGLVILPLFALVLALPSAPFPSDVRVTIQRVLGLGVIGSIGWAVVLLVQLVSDTIYTRYMVEVENNLAARRIRTQTQLLNRVVTAIVAIITLAIMLMTFPSVRHIGVSLLASAGLAGLVVGMAARSTLASLIAGIQLAMTQPIRLDDVVVVEGYWGWVEEINTTYVGLRVWDLRRLVVPLTYFIEKPFENWTRTRADLLGTVMFYVDYGLSVEEVRNEFHRILESSSLWDRKAWGLQVTDVTEKTMQLRALMSASNGSKLWDLRCYVREMLIRYLQGQHPESLPLLRRQDVAVPRAAQQHGDGSGREDGSPQRT